MITAIQRLVFFFVSVLLFSNQHALAQTSTPYDWKNVAIGGGGFVTGIITSKEQPGLMYARTDVGGAYCWNATNNTWVPLMDWASENQQGMLGTESIAIDPQSPNIVYMSAGISYFNNGRSYILRSTDFGANFTITEVTSQFKIHGNGMGRQNGERLQVDPNNSNIIYCGTRWNGLWKSTNAGAAWSRLTGLDVNTTSNQNGVCFVLADKSSIAEGVTQRLFAGISRTGNDQNFYRSDDAGATFTAIVNPGLGSGQMPQRAVFSGDGNVIISYGNGGGPYGTTAEPFDQGQIWKYNIQSGAWTNISPTNRPIGGISVDPNNPMRMVASTINTYNLQYSNVYGDRFFYTTNGGASWTDLIASRGFVLDPNGVSWISGQSIHWAGSIEFDPANTNRVLVTSGNGIFVNEDIRTSNVWKFNVKGLEETVPLNLVSIPNGPIVSVIGDYDGFRHTDVSQYAPIHNPRMGTTTGLDFAALSINKLVRVGSSMYYSNDMGVNWIKTTSINGNSGQVALSANGNILLHSPNNSSITYRSVNNGTNWTTVSGLNIGSARPVADPVNSNKFYAYANSNGSIPNGTVMVSTDGGVSFTAAGNAGSWGSKIIRTVPGREGHLWIPLYEGGLTRSVNSGSSFTNIAGVTYCGAVGIGKAAPEATYETIYIWGTANGVLGLHRSSDEGATWLRVNDEEHEYGGPANGQFVVGDMNVFGRVYMSTAGRGIVYGDPSTSMPVTFASINVNLVNKDAAAYSRLVWQTATEINNKYFEVERSFNGTEWNKISVITSKALNGNSTGILSYDFEDDVTFYSGIIYYRLKQVDLDGNAKYSSIVQVNKGAADQNMFVQVYPNPVTNAGFRVRLLSSKDDMVKVSIVNAAGNTVYTGNQNKIITGENVLVVSDVQQLAAGMYIVQIFNSSNKLIGTSRLIK